MTDEILLVDQLRLMAAHHPAEVAFRVLDGDELTFAQWEAISGTVLKFEEGGLVAPQVDVNTSDNQNAIFWAKKTDLLVNGEMDNINGALGVTFNSYFTDNNAQAEADIVFNGAQYTWSTDFNSADTTRQFVEGTATHEIGHLLGLRHSPVGGATMLFHGGGGVNVQSGLSSDEVAAAKWLYGNVSTLATLGKFQGRVTMNGSSVFGAAVLAEEAASGNLAAGTVSRADGSYVLPALPPGRYNVRVTPLDAVGTNVFLIRGRDIASAGRMTSAYFDVTYDIRRSCDIRRRGCHVRCPIGCDVHGRRCHTRCPP